MGDFCLTRWLSLYTYLCCGLGRRTTKMLLSICFCRRHTTLNTSFALRPPLDVHTRDKSCAQCCDYCQYRKGSRSTPPCNTKACPHFLPCIPSVFCDAQDWCVAAAAGSAVPEVHLVWCCRSMAEMELVGEAIPSMLASAGTKKDSHFTLSLYCTSKVRASKSCDRHSISCT